MTLRSTEDYPFIRGGARDPCARQAVKSTGELAHTLSEVTHAV
jgi:hypothetical protein